MVLVELHIDGSHLAFGVINLDNAVRFDFDFLVAFATEFGKMWAPPPIITACARWPRSLQAWCLGAASKWPRTPDQTNGHIASASRRSRTRCRLSGPRWDAQLGAEQLYAAYRMAGLLLKEFEGPRYLRIAHIQRLLAEGILTPDLRHRRCFARVPRSQAAE